MSNDKGKPLIVLLLLLLVSSPGMVMLGLVIHVWTIGLAWTLEGFGAALSTLILPVLSPLVIGFAIWSKTGTFLNLYCVSLLVYVGLWGLTAVGVFAGDTELSSSARYPRYSEPGGDEVQ